MGRCDKCGENNIGPCSCKLQARMESENHAALQEIPEKLEDLTKEIRDQNKNVKHLLDLLIRGHDPQRAIHIREIVAEWIKNLKSGDGDWKKVYTENYMDLLIKLGVANPADKMLLADLKGIIP